LSFFKRQLEVLSPFVRDIPSEGAIAEKNAAKLDPSAFKLRTELPLVQAMLLNVTNDLQVYVYSSRVYSYRV
jgi:hypothetical protein